MNSNYLLVCMISIWGLYENQVNAQEDTNLNMWNNNPPVTCPFEQSEMFVGIGFTDKITTYTEADTWYPFWSEDGNMYSPFTDGTVGEVNSWCSNRDSRGYSEPGFATISGENPLDLQITNTGIFKETIDGNYDGRYPCATIIHKGVWYYGTYALKNIYNTNYGVLGPFCGFSVSRDMGKNWEKSPFTPENPMFDDTNKNNGSVKIGAPHIVDFGQGMKDSPDGKLYLVAHGSAVKDKMPRHGNNSWITADQVYLIRVTPSPETINDPNAYEFFAGHDENGAAIWSNDFSAIKPIAEWNNRMGCVTMVYNAPLKKYLMCVTDGQTTLSRYNSYILESDNITGSWKMLSYMKDFGEMAYFLNIPSKFISDDGMSMFLCYSTNWINIAKKRVVYPINPEGGSYGMTLAEIKTVQKEDVDNRKH